MGFSGISIWQLLILFLVVLVVFGSKKLANLGSDLGQAINNFKKALNETDSPKSDEPPQKPLSQKDSAD